MRKNCIIIFSFTCFFFVDTVRENRWVGKYDYFLLAQSWPLTSYWKYTQKWTTADCELSAEACLSIQKNQWVIHGLWPQKNNGKNPVYCYKYQPSYNSSLISDNLKSKLKEKILSYNKNQTEESLWKFQWEKHGSCAADRIVLNNVTKYFSKILEVFDRYYIGNILENAGIVPGKESYNFETITGVIRAKLGIEPIIRCAFNKHNINKEQYLSEIHICMNKELKIDKCGSRHNHSCDKEKKIIYYPEWTVTDNTEPDQ